MSNEKTFSDYIKSTCKEHPVITKEWVLWMLGQLEHANKHGFKINPQWISANTNVDWFTPHGLIKDSEPPMYEKV